MSQRPDVRARDIDRALASTALDRAYSDGQLSFDEHRLRTERARVAATLSDLRRLLADLQMDVDLPEPPPRTPTAAKGRVLLALASVVVVAVGLTAFLVSRGDDQPAASAATSISVSPPIVPMDLPTDVVPIVARPFVFVTEEGLDDLRARYIERFGTSEVLELSIQPDEDARADVWRVSTDGRRERVFVDGGFQVYGSTELLQDDEPPFDWNLVNSAALARLIAETPATVGVPEAVVDWATVDIDAGAQRISISASDPDRRGGRVEADFAGNILAVTRSSP